MAQQVAESASYRNTSASAQIAQGQGQLLGIFVASSTSGTIKVWDSTAATQNVLVNTFNATAATFYPIPARFTTGLYVTVGGTADITVFFNAG